MIIKATLRNAISSTDPTAADVRRFLGRHDAVRTSERHASVTTTRTRTLEELYPSLFAEPRLHTLRDAATAAVDLVTALVELLRRQLLRSRTARRRRAGRLL